MSRTLRICRYVINIVLPLKSLARDKNSDFLLLRDPTHIDYKRETFRSRIDENVIQTYSWLWELYLGDNILSFGCRIASDWNLGLHIFCIEIIIVCEWSLKSSIYYLVYIYIYIQWKKAQLQIKFFFMILQYCRIECDRMR